MTPPGDSETCPAAGDGALGSTGGKRRTAATASAVTIDFSATTILGTGDNGFSRLVAAGKRRSVAADSALIGGFASSGGEEAAAVLFAASDTGFGSLCVASVGGEVARCGSGGGFAGSARVDAGGRDASPAAAGMADAPAICQTIG